MSARWLLMGARQARSVALLKRVGAEVGYVRPARASAWQTSLDEIIASRLGVDYVQDVVSVDQKYQYSDVVLDKSQLVAAIECLPRLQQLTLNVPDLEAQHVAVLASCNELESVEVIRGDLSDASVELLCRLPNLRNLKIIGVNIGEVGMQAIAGTRIERLELLDATFQCDPLEKVGQMQQLTNLALLDERRGAIRSFRPIAGLPRLESLSLSGASVPEDDLKYVTQLGSLRYLGLANGPAVSTSGAKTLSQLKALRRLDAIILNRSVIEEIRQSLPNCDIGNALFF
jgi:hypothetical protein